MKVMEERALRVPEHAVDELFLRRWSPRAMSGEELSREELMCLFEAAKWAPSSYNNQSWRFVFALRGTPAWKTFLGLLIDGNQSWAKNGAALVLIASKTTYDHDGMNARTHSFDAGAAWENLALQGSLKGLVVHGMEGFDYLKARKTLEVPPDYSVEAMAVIGRHGRKEDLPAPFQAKEKPSQRKKLAEIVFEGKFGAAMDS